MATARWTVLTRQPLKTQSYKWSPRARTYSVPSMWYWGPLVKTCAQPPALSRASWL